MSKKCTPLWCEAHLEVKSVKNWRVRALLEVEMLKKRTPLWREAHSKVKMYKAHVQSIFRSWDVQKAYAVVARSTFPSQNVKSTTCPDHFQMSFRVAGVRDSAPCQTWAKREGFVAFQLQPPLHHTTLHYIILQLQLHLHYILLLLHYTPLHNTARNYTQLHSTTLHYTKLHSNTFHFTTLHYTTLHSTTLHYTTPHSTTLHYTTLPSTTLRYIALHYTPLH